ncbi:hypothetical protein V7161_19895 [Neobacillus drentensis]|uniref:hypothetical protein n=1 Tax=Neobacillus drentensis TaxID=220684 RepID=UPI0030035F36
MVTAILIPIICLYFFGLTRKERKEHDKKWLSMSHVHPEAILTGEIKSIVEEKQRFYYHRYIFVQILQIQTDAKLITAKKITPIIESVITESFQIGEKIRVFGKWEGTKFLFSQYEKHEER